MEQIKLGYGDILNVWRKLEVNDKAVYYGSSRSSRYVILLTTKYGKLKRQFDFLYWNEAQYLYDSLCMAIQP